MEGSFQKYQKGRSGAFTSEYHELLGATPWIVVKRLLRNGPPTGDQLASASTEQHGAITAAPSPSLSSEEISEGDIATVFSQFGEVVDVRFVRHRKTGRFLGTAFVQYADYRSGIAAADAMNSNVEEKDLVILSVGGHKSHSSGITVERCEEVEVPAMANQAAETYAEWEHRVCEK